MPHCLKINQISSEDTTFILKTKFDIILFERLLIQAAVLPGEFV